MRGSKFMRKYHVRIEIHAQPFANIMRGSKFMRKYHVWIEIHAQPFDSFSSLDFTNVSFTPGVGISADQNRRDRDDRIWRASVSLSRAINQWLSLSAQYSFIDNASNVDAYDHTRHIAGVYATIRIQ